MLPIHGLHRNPFRFLITPPTLVVSDVYFPLDQAPAAFWNFVRSDGGDVRVLKQDGVTPVPFQIVGFNSTTKVGQLYIKASSATAFYVYFGNRQFTGLAATDTYGRRAVWETAAVLVMHGEDVTDSSSYNNSNVSATPPTSAAGTIGNGMQFNGTTQYADMGNAAVLQILGNMSIMCWVHPITIATSYRQILGKDYNIYYPAPYDYYIRQLGSWHSTEATGRLGTPLASFRPMEYPKTLFTTSPWQWPEHRPRTTWTAERTAQVPSRQP